MGGTSFARITTVRMWPAHFDQQEFMQGMRRESRMKRALLWIAAIAITMVAGHYLRVPIQYVLFFWLIVGAASWFASLSSGGKK